jgi:hypothetical protein
MKKYTLAPIVIIASLFLFGCGPSYKIKPVSFKAPDASGNAVMAGGALMSGTAFADSARAKEAFGFDIHAAGMLPVQVVFDNQGTNQLEINSSQTFLEDAEGNLWPILSNKIANERATKYAETNAMIKEGASKGLLGALAGAVIGAAVGIVTDEGVAASAGKGAAVGAAAGATMGGAGVYGSGKTRRDIIDDLHDKSFQNGFVEPKSISHGLIFFPGEATSALKLRLQLVEVESGRIHAVNLPLAQD